MWRAGDVRAIRRGDHKLVDVQGTPFLFDLRADPEETTNLADAEPALLARLTEELDSATEDFKSPQWEGQETPISYYGTEFDIRY